MDLEAKRAMVRRIRSGLSVTEIFCTRILKTNRGSVLVGLTASLDDPSSIEEGEIAALILGEKVDQLALDRALAGSIITAKERTYASALTRDNYHLLIDERLQTNGKAVPAVLVGATEKPAITFDPEEEVPEENEDGWLEGLSA